MGKDTNCPVSRWRRRKEARPSEILDAALELFCQKGYAATTLEQVARTAGISKGTLYLYYDNKEELFRSMVRELLVPHVEDFERQAGEFSGNSAELLRGMALGWWETVGGSPLAGMPKLMIAEASNFPELAKYYVDTVIVRARNLVAKILERGMERNEFKQCDPDMTARILLSSLVFTAIWKNSLGNYDSPFSVNDYINQQIDVTLNGLLKN
jgi:AcrR family transcriptional regulator